MAAKTSESKVKEKPQSENAVGTVQAQPEKVAHRQTKFDSEIGKKTPKAPTKRDLEAKPLKVEDLVEINKDEYDIPLERANKKVYIAGFAVLAVVFILTGAIFFFRTKQPLEKTDEIAVEIEEVDSEDLESTVDKQEKETQDTKNEETDELTRSEISLEILNGSGVSGAAGDTADTFESLGYEDIDTGNAGSTASNELYVQKDSAGKIDILLADVKDKLGISKVTGELEDLDTTARIVLGSEE